VSFRDVFLDLPFRAVKDKRLLTASFLRDIVSGVRV
jgi:hypothetical protein